MKTLTPKGVANLFKRGIVAAYGDVACGEVQTICDELEAYVTWMDDDEEPSSKDWQRDWIKKLWKEMDEVREKMEDEHDLEKEEAR